MRAATGGGAIDGPGCFLAPTLPVDVPEGAEAARDEIFGPFVTVETSWSRPHQARHAPSITPDAPRDRSRRGAEVSP
ncbi:aldehyde dehydrogenase family protein [Streptomyces sp. NBC_01445]|uniref:aldehyde dehydrogenase family protein n=1 Tax=Streptomyces sp. NBC_01445 TaxID=2903869 RepID=UPI002DDC0580|nr:aldehyde dehydrogenase family protein [Streptomyces sp. NBC_01445]WSE09719.1 aldehyde dehydrogenase family protein [Streptomyces sp. NBC_01445]